MLPTIQTYSGKYIDLLQTDLYDIDIRDIAHALSNLGRFTGHSKRFYSVAQHSVIASNMVYLHPEIDYHMMQVCALLHDASEAYLGDVSSPLKQLLPAYKEIEKGLEYRIAQRFCLPQPMPKQIKDVDLILLATEKRDLMPQSDYKWEMLDGVQPLVMKIVPLSPERAEWLFLERAKELGLL